MGILMKRLPVCVQGVRRDVSDVNVTNLSRGCVRTRVLCLSRLVRGLRAHSTTMKHARAQVHGRKCALVLVRELYKCVLVVTCLRVRIHSA